MRDEIQKFYPEGGDYFYQVIPLHESPHESWETISQQIPFLPRGWFELSRLPVEDRIEFSRDFWLSKLPVHEMDMVNRIEQFFNRLEDIGIFLTQEKKDQPFDVHMVYSLKDAEGFFQGNPPANEEALVNLERQFIPLTLPPDYFAFLQVHDGFNQYIDTGLIKTREMAKTYQRFQQRLIEEPIFDADAGAIDPTSLIPFYESSTLHCYQCFYADWYPEEEMGNVYVSGEAEYHLEKEFSYHTFLDWLVFYLEDTQHSFG